jgi:two-component system, NtrC family, nitrogen regulation response regulator NtrX
MAQTVLVVDDEESIRNALRGILEDEGYSVILAKDGLDALALLQLELPDLVLLDIWMPRLDGLETLGRMKQLYPDLAIVMISGHGTIETAVRCTKLGAFDFIEKPLSLEKVLVTVHNAIGMSRLQQENSALRGMMEESFEVVGESEAVKLLREQIMIVAPTSAAILICGENGTGREAVAHEIHRCSSRRDKPFIIINCASIPEELLESEIFGHEKGAFAGANSQRKGKLDLADEGTLFLEEVADLPLNAQFKLQKVIEENKFERMGGVKSIDVNVRIMTSTSRNLEEGIKNGTFCENLYYHLNVVPFDLMPLRDRKQDIPALVDNLLEQFCRREMRERKRILPEAIALMERYDWPGNIREMRNIIERLVIMTPGRIISVEQLPDMILEGSAFSRRLAGVNEPAGESQSLREAREEFEREFIINKLDENDWNVTRTAEAIELERSNLHRKIKSYGIDMKKI